MRKYGVAGHRRNSLRRAAAPSPPSTSQPEARVSRAHRLGDHAEQVGAHRVQVNLVPQPRAEGVEGARSVVARAVEATVDEALDPGTQRLEQRDHREGRAGDGELAARRERMSSAWLSTTPAAYVATSPAVSVP